MLRWEGISKRGDICNCANRTVTFEWSTAIESAEDRHIIPGIKPGIKPGILMYGFKMGLYPRCVTKSIVILKHCKHQVNCCTMCTVNNRSIVAQLYCKQQVNCCTIVL